MPIECTSPEAITIKKREKKHRTVFDKISKSRNNLKRVSSANLLRVGGRVSGVVTPTAPSVSWAPASQISLSQTKRSPGKQGTVRFLEQIQKLKPRYISSMFALGSMKIFKVYSPLVQEASVLSLSQLLIYATL